MAMFSVREQAPPCHLGWTLRLVSTSNPDIDSATETWDCPLAGP